MINQTPADAGVGSGEATVWVPEDDNIVVVEKHDASETKPKERSAADFVDNRAERNY